MSKYRLYEVKEEFINEFESDIKLEEEVKKLKINFPNIEIRVKKIE